MTVLLTGATGFLGRQVHQLLLAANQEEVITLGRINPAPLSRRRHLTYDLGANSSTTGVFVPLSHLAASVGYIDWICHLAAYVPREPREDRWERAYDTNVLGSIRLLRAFGSPDQVGNVMAGSIESMLPPRTWYGASKLAAEGALALLHAREGIAMSTLRFTSLYGPGDPIRRAIPIWVARAQANQPLIVEGGSELRDYLHVQDAASAVLAAARAGLPPHPYVVATGNQVSMLDVAEMIVTELGSSSTIEVHERTRPGFDVVLDALPFVDATGWLPARVFPEGVLPA